MTTYKKTKLRKLIEVLHKGNVITVALLDSIGISNDLRKYYLKSGWIEPLGRGAYKKPNDNIEWQGAVNAIQKQNNIHVHVGGLSALSLQGYSHYLRLSKESLQLFSPQRTKLPKWFLDYHWEVDLFHKQSSFLSNSIGFKEMDIKQISVTVSTPERAILECLYLAPQTVDLVECYQLLEGLINLKPKLITELLVSCNSVKVKRVFLYMAEKVNHQWFQFIQTDNIDLGKGKRMITEKGNSTYIAKYLISIPKDLAEL